MRYEDESYVRVYRRNTIAWRMLPWEARTTLLHLFRAVDRAGLLDVGEYGPEGVAALLELPVEVVATGLAKLIEKGTVTWAGQNGDVLFIPNFLTAQEAHSSDAQRKRDQRERAAAAAKLEVLGVAATTESPDNSSRHVTSGPESGPKVTIGHKVSLCAVPCSAEPSEPSSEETYPDSADADSGSSAGVQEGFKLESPAETTSSLDFEAAYALFPRKEGKSKGLKRAESKIRTKAQYDRFVAAIANYARHVAGRETDKVKQFDTFVGCWEDYAPGNFQSPPAGAGRDLTRGQVPVSRGLDYSNGGTK